MHPELLATEIQNFIDSSVGSDISRLALQKNPFPQVPWPEILNQIAAKTKAKDKLPGWFNTEGILYPAKLSIEQASSEQTAAYKASLISGDNLIDLTGGFGVDDFYFSKRFKKVVHCELNADLSAIVSHNIEQMQVASIDCICADSTEALERLQTRFDWIYIDPSRRNEVKGKVFMLRDCEPNVPEMLGFYFKYTSNILIKTAPVLDIAAGLSELQNVRAIHIVAIDNEVKELLWEISLNATDALQVNTVNLLKKKQQRFSFTYNQNIEAAALSLPGEFIFEPNAAIMKSGGFNEIARQFDLKKLHANSHLYTSDKVVAFPGRIFSVQRVIAYRKNEMKAFLENRQANVTVRNFPDTVESIRRKWKIKDGGDCYCFFTTDKNDDKIVLICTKLNEL